MMIPLKEVSGFSIFGKTKVYSLESKDREIVDETFDDFRSQHRDE